MPPGFLLATLEIPDMLPTLFQLNCSKPTASLLPLFLPLIGSVMSLSVMAQELSTRLRLDEARRMVAAEDEGNLLRQAGRFTRTRLTDGRVIEIYYPVTTGDRSPRKSLPGYGLLYPSEEAFRETIRPRHILEEVLPDGHDFIARIPELIRRLERRLLLAPGRLELTRSGLHRLDRYLRQHHANHTTAETDPRLFQELTACYGETLRRALDGKWTVQEVEVGRGRHQTEPNLIFGASQEIKPWRSIVRALNDEDSRGIGLVRLFDSDSGRF